MGRGDGRPEIPGRGQDSLSTPASFREAEIRINCPKKPNRQGEKHGLELGSSVRLISSAH